PCEPVTSPLNDPEKLVAVVALVALPARLAVIVPAEKLPEASRETMVFGVLALVAVVAELATLPAVAMVPHLVSAIAAVALTSALTIVDVERFPEESVCTTPAAFNPSIETTPADEIFIRSAPAVLIDNVSAVAAAKPVVGLLVKFKEGVLVVP